MKLNKCDALILVTALQRAYGPSLDAPEPGFEKRLSDLNHRIELFLVNDHSVVSDEPAQREGLEVFARALHALHPVPVRDGMLEFDFDARNKRVTAVLNGATDVEFTFIMRNFDDAMKLSVWSSTSAVTDYHVPVFPLAWSALLPLGQALRVVYK